MAKIHSANEEIECEESASKQDPHHVLVIDDIRKSLKSLSPAVDPTWFIYRVRKQLRTLNEAAYTPQVVSIGPLHYGTKTLIEMDKHKLRYLGNFLKFAGEKDSLDKFYNTIKNYESSIRSCYAETLDYLSSDKFVKMIIVDACFIFGLFLGKYSVWCSNFESTEWADIYLEHLHEFQRQPWLLYEIERDLTLLENQLPFFILKKLYELAFPSSPNNCPYHLNQKLKINIPDFEVLTCVYFSDYNFQGKSIEQKVNQFTDLLRYFWLPRRNQPEIDGVIKPNDKSIQQKNRFTDLLLRRNKTQAKVKDVGRISCSYSATELHDAGVKFKASKNKCLLDIKFSHGVLTIPCFTLQDNTESNIRNLMALEQCHYPNELQICDYVSTMDRLINTAKDVDLLVQKKIIVNNLGDRKQVATLFNNLCTHIVLSNSSRYSGDCRDLNAYYNAPCHKWKAILYEEYFSTPWRTASTTAAFIFLALTLTQATCAIISM